MAPSPAHACSNPALGTTAGVDNLPCLGVQSTHHWGGIQAPAEAGLSCLEPLNTNGQLLPLLRLALCPALPYPESVLGAAHTPATVDKL